MSSLLYRGSLHTRCTMYLLDTIRCFGSGVLALICEGQTESLRFFRYTWLTLVSVLSNDSLRLRVENPDENVRPFVALSKSGSRERSLPASWCPFTCLRSPCSKPSNQWKSFRCGFVTNTLVLVKVSHANPISYSDRLKINICHL